MMIMTSRVVVKMSMMEKSVHQRGGGTVIVIRSIVVVIVAAIGSLSAITIFPRHGKSVDGFSLAPNPSIVIDADAISLLRPSVQRRPRRQRRVIAIGGRRWWRRRRQRKEDIRLFIRTLGAVVVRRQMDGRGLCFVNALSATAGAMSRYDAIHARRRIEQV